MRKYFNSIEFDGIKYGEFATIKGIEFDSFKTQIKNKYTFKHLEFEVFKSNGFVTFKM